MNDESGDDDSDELTTEWGGEPRVETGYLATLTEHRSEQFPEIGTRIDVLQGGDYSA